MSTHITRKIEKSSVLSVLYDKLRYCILDTCTVLSLDGFFFAFAIDWLQCTDRIVRLRYLVLTVLVRAFQLRKWLSIVRAPIHRWTTSNIRIILTPLLQQDSKRSVAVQKIEQVPSAVTERGENRKEEEEEGEKIGSIYLFYPSSLQV